MYNKLDVDEKRKENNPRETQSNNSSWFSESKQHERNITHLCTKQSKECEGNKVSTDAEKTVL